MGFRSWLRRFLGISEVREIRIARSVLDDLCEMARGAHPKEMIAFLSSEHGVRDGVLRIDELQLQAYTASEDSASVHLWQLPTVTGIVGTAHSHPGASARPSSADLHLFSQYGMVHAIIPEPYVPERVRYYDKVGRRVNVRVL